jgi:hypothetical protein
MYGPYKSYLTHVIDSYQELLLHYEDWRNEGWDISSAEENLLQLYINQVYSVYDIQTYIKTADPSSHKNIHRWILNSYEYKNIHRRIRKLKKLKLIEEETSKKTSSHGAKYYKLSEKGVYYIFLKVSSFIGEYLNTTQVFKLLHMNYPDTFIFQLFLHPYVDVRTIEEIHGTAHVTSFWRYLRSCCEAIQDLTGLKEGGEQIFVWADVPPNAIYKFKVLEDKRLAQFLKKRFNLNWLDQADITKIEDDSIVKILHGGKSAIIELIDDNTKALLKIDRKERLKMNVTILKDKENESFVFDILAPPESIHHTQQIHLESKLKMLASKLVLELLSYPMIENDISVLSQDNKFVKLLKQVSEDFNDRCNLITKREST